MVVQLCHTGYTIPSASLRTISSMSDELYFSDIDDCLSSPCDNGERTTRNWSNFEDRFVRTDFGDSSPIVV